MITIIFVCLGNICRSPMAEFIMKEMVKKQGLENEFYIESAATSAEEVGNGMHPGTIAKLQERQIPFGPKKARKFTIQDYEKFDYIIGMEISNLRNINKIISKDDKAKIHRLLDFSKRPRDIADPWYTGNFEQTYQDIVEGCQALLMHIQGGKNGA